MANNEDHQTNYLLSSPKNAVRLRESINQLADVKQLAEITTENLLVEIGQRVKFNDDDFRKLLELWQKLLIERHPRRPETLLGNIRDAGGIE